MHKIRLEGSKVTLRSRKPDDTPVLYNLIYGTENPEWKKFDAPYFPLKKISYEIFRAIDQII